MEWAYIHEVAIVETISRVSDCKEGLAHVFDLDVDNFFDDYEVACDALESSITCCSLAVAKKAAAYDHFVEGDVYRCHFKVHVCVHGENEQERRRR